MRSAPGLVERDFNPATVNRLWCADITHIRTWEGWLYLASVMDCYRRRIVGWAMADHLHAELARDSLAATRLTETSKINYKSQAATQAAQKPRVHRTGADPRR